MMNDNRNKLKEEIKKGREKIGMWKEIENKYKVEICEGEGYEWMMIDGENEKNDVNIMV